MLFVDIHINIIKTPITLLVIRSFFNINNYSLILTITCITYILLKTYKSIELYIWLIVYKYNRYNLIIN